MNIIFAQGNPGTRYQNTRHNVGFLALDAFAASLGATWRESGKFTSLIAETAIGGEKVLLVKPLSFYNDTGLVARALVDFYKISPATDFLVLHDELALPLGTVRFRTKGSDAGNNGIKSLNSHLGQNYCRIRIGTWTPLRDERPDVDFVLSNFSSDESSLLKEKVVPEVEALCQGFIAGEREARSVRVKK